MIEWIVDWVFRIFYGGCCGFLVLVSILATFLFFNDGDDGDGGGTN